MRRFGVLLVAVSIGCAGQARRIETLETELAASRRCAQEAEERCRELARRNRALEGARARAARAAELESEVANLEVMNESLRGRIEELDKLWSDALAQTVDLGRQIYGMTKEREGLEEERDRLYAKLKRPEAGGGAEKRTLTELDVRIAELKGVCLYFPAQSFPARQAKEELTRLQAQRLALLNPGYPTRPEPRSAPAAAPASVPPRALWAEKHFEETPESAR